MQNQSQKNQLNETMIVLNTRYAEFGRHTFNIDRLRVEIEELNRRASVLRGEGDTETITTAEAKQPTRRIAIGNGARAAVKEAKRGAHEAVRQAKRRGRKPATRDTQAQAAATN